jgi:hypothetical protein
LALGLGREAYHYGETVMTRLNILMTAAALLVSLASTPVVAQEINILGPGRGWKLQP